MVPKQLPFQVFQFKTSSPAKIRGAAIIVLQEWWGINDQIKSHAQKLADSTGAMTVVPDLYKGKIGVTAEEAGHLMQNLDWKQSVKELEELATQLREAKYSKLGSIGFCMGGGLSLALAARLAETPHPLKAAVTCYGTPPQDLFDTRVITTQTPVQGHFGGKDSHAGFSDPAAADALEFNLHTNKMNSADIYRYPDQGHAFLNDDDWSVAKRKELGFVDANSDPVKTEKDVRNLAWTRITDFFVKHLGGEHYIGEDLSR